MYIITMITFEKFFLLLETKNISQNQAIRDKIIDARLLNALKHNKSITTNSLNEICNKLNCTPYEIITFTPDKKGKEN